MGLPIINANREAAVWARLMQSQTNALSPEAAEYLLSIELPKSDRSRMEQLAERSEAGTLTEEERAEFEGYLHVGNLLAVMQSKARVALGRKPTNPHIP
jgi:hypothetical protein